MNEPNLDDLSQFVPSKFTLVTLAMKRARQLKAGAPKLIDTPSMKPVTIALQEILAQKVRPLPLPPAEELEAREQAELLAAIGLAEPTSVSVARRMEELIYGAEEGAEEAEEYDEDYLHDEEEEESPIDLGLDEEEEEHDEARPEADFLPEEEEETELGTTLSLDEIDEEDAEASDDEEEEEESFAETEDDPLLARPAPPIAGADEEVAVKPKRAGRPAKSKAPQVPSEEASEETPSDEAAPPAPKRAGRKPKA